jgi:hypothetical protein
MKYGRRGSRIIAEKRGEFPKQRCKGDVQTLDDVMGILIKMSERKMDRDLMLGRERKYQRNIDKRS